jgi:ABC-2 type transport system ATP-binding protein
MTNISGNVIEISNISKFYPAKLSRHKAVAALVNVSLGIREGEIFSLLGPNGAGKTTLVKILLGITLPSHGTATVLGLNPGDGVAKAQIGFLPEDFVLPAHLRVREVLTLWGGFYLAPQDLKNRIPKVLEEFRIAARADSRIKTLSKGMLQRACLAQALIHKPRLLFLDEPTDGLDPVGRREIRELLLNLKEEGVTIFLNSHLLSEVEKISDRVGILKDGKVLAVSSLPELTASKGGYVISVSGSAIEEWCKKEGFVPVKEGNLWNISVSGPAERDRAVRILSSAGMHIEGITSSKSDLEEAFISIINAADDPA